MEFFARFFTTTTDMFRPVMCIVRLKYDETPTKVRVSSRATESINLQEATVEKVANTNVLGTETSATHAKVFQIEQSLGVLVEDLKRNRYMWTFGHLPASLYGLERTTGEHTFLALQDSIQSVPAYMTLNTKYPINIRHSCSDRYTANKKAESLLNAVFPETTLVHLFCDVHRLYTCTKNSMSIADRDVSGCLAFALGFGEPGLVATMRQALARILISKLKVIHDAVPEGQVAHHREELFDTFLPVKDVSAT